MQEAGVEKKLPETQVSLNINHSPDCTFTLEVPMSKFID